MPKDLADPRRLHDSIRRTLLTVLEPGEQPLVVVNGLGKTGLVATPARVLVTSPGGWRSWSYRDITDIRSGIGLKNWLALVGPTIPAFEPGLNDFGRLDWAVRTRDASTIHETLPVLYAALQASRAAQAPPEHPTGWCPRCGGVVAPWMSACDACGLPWGAQPPTAPVEPRPGVVAAPSTGRPMGRAAKITVGLVAVVLVAAFAASQATPTDEVGAPPVRPTPGVAPLVITEPADGVTVSAPKVRLLGTGPAGVEVARIEGGISVQRVPVNGEGRWSMTVTLDPGANDLTFRAGGDPATDLGFSVVLEAPTPRPRPTPRPTPVGYLTKAMFGRDWPFTVPEGVVRCEPGSIVVFRAGGVDYAVNGMAMSWAKRNGYEDLEPIWRDDPKLKGFKISIGPIIDAGLELCD